MKDELFRKSKFLTRDAFDFFYDIAIYIGGEDNIESEFMRLNAIVNKQSLRFFTRELERRLEKDSSRCR